MGNLLMEGNNMLITEDYTYTKTRLIEAGYTDLTVHSLRFDRFYTEEEKEQNRQAAESMTVEQWHNRCEESSREIYRQLIGIIPLFEKYGIIYRVDPVTNHGWYESPDNLYFYSNRGWNGKDYFDYFTLSFDRNEPAEEIIAFKNELVSMLEKSNTDTPNIRCVVQYDTKPNNNELAEDAEIICKELEGKTIEYGGMKGKIKRLGDCWTFWKLRAKRTYYHINNEELVMQYKGLIA